jgi:hypothetical protein
MSLTPEPGFVTISNAFRDFGPDFECRNVRHGLSDPRTRPLAKNLRTRPLAQIKGLARVQLAHGAIYHAEVHWYEAAGIGRKEFKIKHLLQD